LNLFLLFLGDLFCAVELQDRIDPYLPHADSCALLLAVVFAAAQLALNQDVRALLERAGEIGELSKDDATMPLGVRNILAILLVRRLGCQRESCDAAVVVSADLSIVAEEADEIYFVLVHGDTPFWNFPN